MGHATMRNVFTVPHRRAIVVGVIIAQAAYQARLAAITTAVATPPRVVVTPVAPGAYPYGYGWGSATGRAGLRFSIFGFLGTLLFTS